MADDYLGLKTILNTEESVTELKSDGNYGLSKLLLQALTKRRIKNQVSVFSRMKFSDIASLVLQDVQLTQEELESVLSELIASGDIAGSIDQQSQVVSFSSGDTIDYEHTVSTLSRSMQEVIEIDDRIREHQFGIMQSQAFIVRKMKASSKEQDSIGDFTATYSDNEMDDYMDSIDS